MGKADRRLELYSEQEWLRSHVDDCAHVQGLRHLLKTGPSAVGYLSPARCLVLYLAPRANVLSA